MQDIAGLRVILPTVPDVRAFHEAMLKSPAKHEPIVPADDYINKPKKMATEACTKFFDTATLHTLSLTQFT